MAKIIENILRLGVDNAQFKRAMSESSRLVNRSESQWKGYAKILTTELGKVNSELKEMLKSVKSMEDVKGIRKLESSARSLRKELESINTAGGRGGGGRKGGGAGGMLGGLGMGLARLIPALAPIIIGMQAYGAAKTLAGPEVNLAGLIGVGGLKGVQAGRGRAAKLGFGPTEQTGAAGQLAGQVGGAGGTGDILNLSRAYGMDVGQLTGAAGGFRRAGLSGDQAIKTVADTLATAITAKIERSRIGEFLQITSQMTEQLASQGIQVDPTAINRMAGTLAAASTLFTARPQLIRQSMGAVSDLLQRGTGSRFGFAAEAMQKAAGKAGKTLTGAETLYEMSLGLGKGGKLDPNQRFKGIMDLIGTVAPKEGGSRTRELIGGGILGISPSLFGEFMKTYESQGKLSEKELEEFDKKVREEQKSPQARSAEIMQTISGQLKSMDARSEMTLAQLGQKIAPTVLEIRDVLIKGMSSLTDLAEHFGVGKKGLVTQLTEGVTSMTPHAIVERGRRRRDVLDRLKEDRAPISDYDRQMLDKMIRNPSFGPQGRSRILSELQEKEIRGKTTEENTAALIELIKAIQEDTSEKKRKALSLDGREPGTGQVKYYGTVK